MGKKGSLTVEDLVCFVNVYTGNFFRNRDMLLLMRRISKKGVEKNSTLEY